MAGLKKTGTKKKSGPKNNDKHERIIKAAMKVFAKKGFFNSRISDVAKEASIADGTVYLYFKNKDDILIHLFEEEMDNLLKIAKEQVDSVSDPRDKLHKYVSWQLSTMEANRNLFEVLMVEMRQSNKFMKEYVNVKFLELLNIIESVIKLGQQQGLIRSELPPRILKRVIYGALSEIITSWLLSGGQKYDDLQLVGNQIVDTFINGLKVEAGADQQHG